jgi:hypothetical protein
MELGAVIERLYASEINCSISTFWDGGIAVKLGDELNGFVAGIEILIRAAFLRNLSGGFRCSDAHTSTVCA